MREQVALKADLGVYYQSEKIHPIWTKLSMFTGSHEHDTEFTAPPPSPSSHLLIWLGCLSAESSCYGLFLAFYIPYARNEFDGSAFAYASQSV